MAGMNRRQFTARLSASLSATMAAAALQPPPSNRPNILLVLSDDHTRQHLGILGDPVIKTPNFDAFGRQGMRFLHFFTAAPQCVPSRAAYMTGRSPVAVRVGRFSTPLPPDIKTLPEHLRAAGYHTGICRRSFHLDGPGAAADQGVGGIITRLDMKTFARRVDFLNVSGNRQQTKPIVNQFLDSVPAGKPFFLWVNFNDPHHVWDRNAIRQPHDPAKIPVPAHLPDMPGMRDDLARYYDEISRADEEFSWLLQILEERKLANNTLVVFAGDNGHAFPHGKGSLYDPGLNVPLLVRWPGKIKANLESEELLSNEDIAPTLLEAAGLAKPAEMSGRSFLPHLLGRPYESRKYIFAARIHHGNAPYTAETKANNFDLSRCVRTRRYKLIYNCTPQQEYAPVDSMRDAGWTEMVAAHREGRLAPQFRRAYFNPKRPVLELFDLEQDPAELENLAGRPELAAVEQELKLALAEKMVLDYDFLPPPV